MKSLFCVVIMALLPSCATIAPSETNTRIINNATVPFTLHDNRILVNVKVNENGPFTFLFDTGGARSNTIIPEVAKKLGLELKPASDARGAGSGEQRRWSTIVKRYSVGALVAENQVMDVLDMSAIRRAFNFPELDGIIGFDILKKGVTCIDFEQRTLAFKESGKDCFSEREKFVIPMRIEHESPIIAGEVNGIKTEFFVDFGDRSAFSLFQKFAKASGLETHFSQGSQVISGFGIGGPIPAKLTILKEIKLGSDLRIEHVLSRLPLTTGNYFARSRLGGSIGTEILKRFNVVLDYPKGEMRLVKNLYFNDPFKFIPPTDP